PRPRPPSRAGPSTSPRGSTPLSPRTPVPPARAERCTAGERGRVIPGHDQLHSFPPRLQPAAARACLMQDDTFQGAAELAGYLLADAVWRLDRDELFFPLIGHERDIQHDRDRAFAVLRPGAADGTMAVRHAEEWLDSNPERVARAALVHDGFLTWEGVRREALYSRIVEYRRPRRSLDIVVPYSRTTGVLALHRPKLFRPV